MRIKTVKEAGAVEMTVETGAAKAEAEAKAREAVEEARAIAAIDGVFSELEDSYEVIYREWDPQDREYYGDKQTKTVLMNSPVDVFYNKTNKTGNPIRRLPVNKLPGTDLDPDLDPEVWHGITLRQLRGIWANVDRRCKEENWKNREGKPLTPNIVTLYDVETHVVRPFTESTRESFVASLPSTSGKQFPRIHVSAPFLLPIRELVICVESFVHDFRTNFTTNHEKRGGGMTEDTPIWLVGFSRSVWNRADYPDDPMHSPMAKAIKAAGNRVLSITDKDGCYFARAWPTFESFLAMEHRLWYIYTAHDSEHHNGAIGLVPGGATSDIHPKDILNREKYFPTSLIVNCFKHNSKNVTASKESDRIHILNTIIGSSDLDAVPSKADDIYNTKYNDNFRAHFATPGTLQAALHDDSSWQPMLDVMKKGQMKMMRFDFREGRGWDGITDDEAIALIKHLPLTIQDLTIQGARNFNSQFIRVLGDLVKESKLTTLYLEDTLVNSCEDEDTIKYFAKALKMNDRLENFQVWRESQKNELKVWEEDVNIVETLARSERVTTSLFAPLEKLFEESNPNFAKITFLLTLFMRMDRSLPDFVTSKQSQMTLKWAQYLSEQERASLLESEAGSFVKSILNRKFTWRKNLATVMFELYVQVIIVALLSTMNGKEGATQKSYFRPLLLSCLFFISFRELLQMWVTYAKDYLKDFCNWFDLAQIGLIYLILSSPSFNIYQPTAICVSWGVLIFRLSNFSFHLATFVIGIFRIFKELLPFLFTVALLTFMFAHAFSAKYANEVCNTTDNEDTWSSCLTLRQSYSKALMMFLSSENWDFDGPGKWLTVGYAFLMAIILLNMIIAVVSNMWTEVQDNAKNVFWTHRYNTTTDIESLWSLFSPLGSLFSSECMVEDGSKNLVFYTDDRINFSLESSQGCKDVKKSEESSQGSKDVNKSEKFFNWWFTRTLDCRCPYLWDRLEAFLKHSHWNDIIYPGKVFERVLLGQNNDEKCSDAKTIPRIAVKILLWLLSIIHVIIMLIVFISGLFTLGISWPWGMKSKLFHVGTKHDVKQIEELHNDNDKLKEEMRKDYYKLRRDIEEHMTQLTNPVKNRVGKSLSTNEA